MSLKDSGEWDRGYAAGVTAAQLRFGLVGGVNCDFDRGYAAGYADELGRERMQLVEPFPGCKVIVAASDRDLRMFFWGVKNPTDMESIQRAARERFEAEHGYPCPSPPTIYAREWQD